MKMNKIPTNPHYLEILFRILVGCAWFNYGEKYYAIITKALMPDLNFYISTFIQATSIFICLHCMAKLPARKYRLPILQDISYIYFFDSLIQLLGFVLWWVGFESWPWLIANSSITAIKLARLCWPDHGFITTLLPIEPWRIAIKKPFWLSALLAICAAYVLWHGYSPSSQSNKVGLRALITMLILGSFGCLIGSYLIIRHFKQVAEDRLSALTHLTSMKAGSSDISPMCQRIIEKLQHATVEQMALAEGYIQVVCTDSRPAANETDFDRAMCYMMGTGGNHIIMSTAYSREVILLHRENGVWFYSLDSQTHLGPFSDPDQAKKAACIALEITSEPCLLNWWLYPNMESNGQAGKFSIKGVNGELMLILNGAAVGVFRYSQQLYARAEALEYEARQKRATSRKNIFSGE
ncbi:hypothetical protein V8J88_05390 [Massilia sp. W12]|uniref:hypothetical protein n=1 Tax=Massilia sp. W12 TaxID=3126507 RepID=UPI0030D0B9C0